MFPYPKYKPAVAADAGVRVKEQRLPYTIIADGFLYRENLHLAGKDEAWLKRTLAEHQADVKSAFLLTLDAGGKVLFVRKEEAQ